MNDLKLALRQLSKNPGFTAMPSLTLLPGITLNLAYGVYLTVIRFRKDRNAFLHAKDNVDSKRAVKD